MHAQEGVADLLAQSPDGRTVKLVWLTRHLPAGFNGFDIKRKDGLGQWRTLNAVPLVPGISVKKDLSPFEPDNTDATRIREKLKDLVRVGKLREYDFATFTAKWAAKDKEIQDIMEMAMLDFDISVICGFAYVDHSVTQKMEYQYGLFLHHNGELVDKISWNYGAVPDLDVVREISSRALPGKPGIELSWSVDAGKARGSFIAGYNVYKRGIRLNDRPITAPAAGEAGLISWKDAGANSEDMEQYSISPESLFGIEGFIRTYNYDPAEHPTAYSRSVVTHIASRGFYYRDGIGLSWTFPKDQERFISGFYVEKDNMPDGYKRVSGLLQPGDRSFVDSTGSPVSAPFRMRVVAAYKDRTMYAGTERMYSYFPLIDPPHPQNVAATVVTERRQVMVNVTWDAPMNGDSTTETYAIWCIRHSGERPVLLAGGQPLRTTSYKYVVPPGVSETLRFFVAAGSKLGGESTSDTVAATTPSTFLPPPSVRATIVATSVAQVQWDFTDVADLAGFRLYRNGTLVADEKVLGRAVREYTVQGLTENTAYSFTVRAVSNRTVVSEASAPASITVPAAKKP